MAQTPVSEATASNNSSPSLEHLDKKDNSENEEDIEEDNVKEGKKNMIFILSFFPYWHIPYKKNTKDEVFPKNLWNQSSKG